jgi:hypothetical protein
MSTYRLLADHFISNQLLQAGTVQTTANIPGGVLPLNFQPSGACEPLDASAVSQFYAQGPQTFPVLIRQQWSTIPVFSPTTFWRQLPYGQRWQLTGLGAGLPPIGV